MSLKFLLRDQLVQECVGMHGWWLGKAKAKWLWINFNCFLIWEGTTEYMLLIPLKSTAQLEQPVLVVHLCGSAFWSVL